MTPRAPPTPLAPPLGTFGYNFSGTDVRDPVTDALDPVEFRNEHILQLTVTISFQ